MKKSFLFAMLFMGLVSVAPQSFASDTESGTESDSSSSEETSRTPKPSTHTTDGAFEQPEEMPEFDPNAHIMYQDENGEDCVYYAKDGLWAKVSEFAINNQYILVPVAVATCSAAIAAGITHWYNKMYRSGKAKISKLKVALTTGAVAGLAAGSYYAVPAIRAYLATPKIV